MKIILVHNKFLSRSGVKRLDSSYWNFYIPLLKMGHKVYFYDTASPEKNNFNQVVDSFKPDLILSCLTGNDLIAPREPLKEITKLTTSGLVKTFNWFCDDTWRFDSFSSQICTSFLGVSTPEPTYIEKYQKIGYNNVITLNWHINSDFCMQYPMHKKKYDVVFIGALNDQRHTMLTKIKDQGFEVAAFHGISQEDMNNTYALSKIGLNFSINENDTEKKTQMKQRMFEIPANRSLLITENTPGLDQFFKLDNEIVTFSTAEECLVKIQALLENENLIETIAGRGYQRYLTDHRSEIRLSQLLNWIGAL